MAISIKKIFKIYVFRSWDDSRCNGDSGVVRNIQNLVVLISKNNSNRSSFFHFDGLTEIHRSFVSISTAVDCLPHFVFLADFTVAVHYDLHLQIAIEFKLLVVSIVILLIIIITSIVGHYQKAAFNEIASCFQLNFHLLASVHHSTYLLDFCVGILCHRGQTFLNLFYLAFYFTHQEGQCASLHQKHWNWLFERWNVLHWHLHNQL